MPTVHRAAPRTTRNSEPSRPAPKTEAAPRAWGPRPATLSPSEKKLISGLVDRAVATPDLVHRGHLRAGLQAMPSTARAAALETALDAVRAQLPCSDDTIRENLSTVLKQLTAERGVPAEASKRTAHALFRDALAHGDLATSLDTLATGGFTATRSELKTLTRQLDAVGSDANTLLQSRDHVTNLSRTLLQVLAPSPASLERFAKNLDSPEVLFGEAIVNRDVAFDRPLAGLVSVLTPRQAEAMARRKGTGFPELTAALTARAKETR